MTDNVVQLFPKREQCHEIPDCEHNRNRGDVGPPIGSVAWSCCGDFAFYVTTDDVRCYTCHKPQVF